MSRSFLQHPPSPSPGRRSEDGSHSKYPPLASLVKYHIPIILLPPNMEKNTLNNAGERLTESKESIYAGPVMPWKRFSPGKHSNNKQRAEDLLNEIIPPREFVDAKKRVWVQRVSSAPVEPYEVTRVKQRLELQMLQRDASSEGICPVRRELFDQCFDELVRQAVLTCPERGLLLARVRDETRMTLSVYRALCEHGAARAQRLEAENEELAVRLNKQRVCYEADMTKLRWRLSEEKARYEAEVASRKREMKKETTRDIEEERRRGEELDFRKKCEEIITQLEMAPVSGSKTL